MESTQHGRLIDLHKFAICHCDGRAYAQWLSGQDSFSKEPAFFQDAESCFLACFGQHSEANLAFLDIEHSVSSMALSKDQLLLKKSDDFPARSNGGEKLCWIKTVFFSG